MNCHAFKSAPDVTISCSYNISFADYWGDVYYASGTLTQVPVTTDPNRRQKACDHYPFYPPPAYRRGIFWNRWWLENLLFEASDTGNFNYITGGGGYPRPWKDTDPFYGRAASMWDSGRIALEALPTSVVYSTNLNFGITANYGAGYNNLFGSGRFQNGETFDIKNGAQVVGSATISIS